MIEKIKNIFYKNKVLSFLFILIIILDKWTKILIKETYVHGESKEILGDFFKITFIENEGIAFGLFSNWDHPLKTVILLMLSIIALVFIMRIYIKSSKSLLTQISFGLILGGAFGNIYDRLIYKKVVDFINIGINDLRIPFFNIADSAITIGVILIMILTFIKKEDL